MDSEQQRRYEFYVSLFSKYTSEQAREWGDRKYPGLFDIICASPHITAAFDRPPSVEDWLTGDDPVPAVPQQPPCRVSASTRATSRGYERAA